MNADQTDSLTQRVLGAVLEVSGTLGAGFLEKVYRRALLRELGLRGIRAVLGFPISEPLGTPTVVG
jgi:GxxExxY protein